MRALEFVSVVRKNYGQGLILPVLSIVLVPKVISAHLELDLIGKTRMLLTRSYVLEIDYYVQTLLSIHGIKYLF